jgi:hypothetical protein
MLRILYYIPEFRPHSCMIPSVDRDLWTAWLKKSRLLHSIQALQVQQMQQRATNTLSLDTLKYFLNGKLHCTEKLPMYANTHTEGPFWCRLANVPYLRPPRHKCLILTHILQTEVKGKMSALNKRLQREPAFPEGSPARRAIMGASQIATQACHLCPRSVPSVMLRGEWPQRWAKTTSISGSITS